MKSAHEVLCDFEISHECEVLSAHRTPELMLAYAKEASSKGFKVLIAGAGGAAHLPGMLASNTLLPVVGVPCPVGPLKGEDALYSIVQMPKGVPVATVGIGNAANAALLAVRILALENSALNTQLQAYREAQKLKNNQLPSL
jgi:phosphoribosylaminoimidazole carboxylase PurE protein